LSQLNVSFSATIASFPERYFATGGLPKVVQGNIASETEGCYIHQTWSDLVNDLHVVANFFRKDRFNREATAPPAE
jgi:hypothetical protein